MKVKFNKTQKSLLNIEKTQDDIAILTKITNSYWEYFKTWLCQKHNMIFTRANKEQYGMCWKCRDELKSNGNFLIEDFNGKRLIKIYPLQNYHTSDIMVIQKFLESLENLEENENMAWEEKKGLATKEWEKKGDEIIGKVIKKDEKVGENESTIYTIELENGEKIGIWESGFLKIPMADVKIGDKIKIIYDGLGKPKQKGFNPPKLFRVFIDK